MGTKDTVSNDYMKDNGHFADAFNYFIYGGEQVIKPEELTSEDSVEATVVNRMNSLFTTKKTRDLLKALNIKRGGNITYVLLGIENQSIIHYAMPVRNLLYDAINYATQVSNEEKRLKKSKKLNSKEYLSGFTKESKIYPVITLVINWSSEKWDAPLRLSEMFEETDSRIMSLINDYEIRLIDPHRITDFGAFHTMLGDVLEFIKNQNNENYLEQAVKEKGEGWVLDIGSINAINTFTGANISLKNAEEGIMKMCRATEVFVEKGEFIKLIKMICNKMSKNKSIEEIAEALDEDTANVQKIYDVAIKYAPDYDVNKIYDELSGKM